METVAFYSYKGGVGRTLLLANTARLLAKAGRRVVALDLDLEAPGLHYKLGTDDALKRATEGTLRGAVDELVDSIEGASKRHSLQDTAIEVDLPDEAGGSLMLIPAGSAPSHNYWGALERLNNSLRDHRKDGGLPEAVLDLQARIADELAPDYLLIDSRTGITELGGLTTSILADRVVCVTAMSLESMEGIGTVAAAVRNAPRLSSQKPVRIDFVITRVPLNAIDSPGFSRLKQFGKPVSILPYDNDLAGLENGLDVKTETLAASQLFTATSRWVTDSFGPSR